MTDFTAIDGRFWRMIRIPYQRDPTSGEGARLWGGRWNARGVPALYLGAGHGVAIAEYHRGLPRPGTLATYDIRSDAIADLTDGDGGPGDRDVAKALDEGWDAIARAGGIPSGWAMAETLAAGGAHGALVPSYQLRGGTNLVLWRWHAAGVDGEGAVVTLLDPHGDLG